MTLPWELRLPCESKQARKSHPHTQEVWWSLHQRAECQTRRPSISGQSLILTQQSINALSMTYLGSFSFLASGVDLGGRPVSLPWLRSSFNGRFGGGGSHFSKVTMIYAVFFALLSGTGVRWIIQGRRITKGTAERRVPFITWPRRVPNGAMHLGRPSLRRARCVARVWLRIRILRTCSLCKGIHTGDHKHYRSNTVKHRMMHTLTYISSRSVFPLTP